MNKEIMKKIRRDMQLDAYFDNIKECSNTTIDYITGEYKIDDIDELIDTLSCIPKYIKKIESIILEMTLEYEREIEVLNEQL